MFHFDSLDIPKEDRETKPLLDEMLNLDPYDDAYDTRNHFLDGE